MNSTLNPHPVEGLGLTIGSRLDTPQGQAVQLDAEQPADLVPKLKEQLDKLEGVEAWFCAAVLRDNYRRCDNWLRSRLAVVDVDYHKKSGERCELPETVVAQVSEVAMKLPSNLFYFTPRGLRLIYIFDRYVDDLEQMRHLLGNVVREVTASLEKLGLEGFEVDRGATVDPVHLMYAPRATVGGHTRVAAVTVLRPNPTVGEFVEDLQIDLDAIKSVPRERNASTPRNERKTLTRKEVEEVRFELDASPPLTMPDGLELEHANAVEVLASIPSADYNDWIDVGQVLHRETDGSELGLELYDRWSQCADRGTYKPGKCEVKWSGFGKNAGGVRWGTVVHLAKHYGHGRSRANPEDVFDSLPSTPSAAKRQGETFASVLKRWGTEGPLVHEATGLQWLDDRTGGGPVYGSRWYLNGAPDAGKTLFGIDLAHKFAERDIPVGLLAVDEEADDLVLRFAQRFGLGRKRAEERSEGDIAKLRKAYQELPMRFYDATWSVPDAAADLHHAFGRPGYLFVDSVQTVAQALDTDGKVGSLREAVGEVVRQIRTAAKTHGHFILASSEMSRAHYRNKKYAGELDPMASGKESSAIEFSARVLLALTKSDDDPNVVELVLAKNKHGEGGPRVKTYLRVDKVRQTLMCDPSYQAPDPSVAAATSYNQKAADIALHITRNPGRGVRDLRNDAKRLGFMSQEDITPALDVLKEAVVKRRAKSSTKKEHYIDGEKLPAAVLDALGKDAQEVASSTPPIGEEGA